MRSNAAEECATGVTHPRSSTHPLPHFTHAEAILLPHFTPVSLHELIACAQPAPVLGQPIFDELCCGLTEMLLRDFEPHFTPMLTTTMIIRQRMT